jgi:EAL domain-containing protein (putative c-di-GMP-specific phosphodiesterase class I)
VESMAHAEHLIALGCPHAQGYLFCGAQSTEDTERMLTAAFADMPRPSLTASAA